MKKLTLKTNAFNKGEVLTRAQLKKVIGGDGIGGSGGYCTGLSFWVETPAYCGYGIGILREDGVCMITEPTVKIPQPCGIA